MPPAAAVNPGHGKMVRGRKGVKTGETLMAHIKPIFADDELCPTTVSGISWSFFFHGTL